MAALVFFGSPQPDAWADVESELRPQESTQLDPAAQFELVFRSTGLLKRTREVAPGEQARAEQLRADAFGLIRALGSGVWTFLTQAPNVGEAPHPISSDDFEFIKSRWATLPMRVCVDTCPCAGTDVMGCALTGAREAFMSTVLLIHPCALESESPKVCAQLTKNLKNQGRAAIAPESVRGMATGMMESGLAQLWGIQAFRANRSLAARASALMKKASAQLDVLTRSCPGPYTRAGQSYLESVGALEELPSTWTDCANRLAEPFRSAEAQADCVKISDKAAWEKWVTRGVLATPLGARRCDGVCELATGCFGADSPRIPRPLVFGHDSYLSLPKGACEGKTPQRPDEFFRVMVARIVRAGVADPEREACVLALGRAFQRAGKATKSSDAANKAVGNMNSGTDRPEPRATLPPLPAELELPDGV